MRLTDPTGKLLLTTKKQHILKTHCRPLDKEVSLWRPSYFYRRFSSNFVTEMANILWSVFTLFVFSNLWDLSYSNGIAQEPQDTVVSVGQTATLTCVISNRSSANSLHVYWFKSESSTATGSAITYRRQSYSQADRGKYFISGTGYYYNLEIVNTEFADGAYYYCSVFAPGNGYVHSRRARLDIHDPDIVPSCSFEPSDRSLAVGDRVTIECLPSQATTSRQSLTMWKGRNGARVPIISRSGDGSLSYEFQLQEEDRNRPYTCTPSGTYPDVNNCTVIPLLHHTINLTPRKATTELGGTARFSCETSGSPPFNQFRWIIGFGRKNVLRLTESSGRYIVSTNGVSGRLTVTNVINSDNNTAVRCQATNSLGERLNEQASVFIRPGPSIPAAGVTTIETSSNRDSANDTTKVTSSSTPTFEDNKGGVVTSGQVFGNGYDAGEQGSSVISTGKTSKERPNTSSAGTIIGILLAILILLVLVVIILLYIRRAQGKPAPKMLKRLSVNRPLLLKRFSVNKPHFLQRISLSKGVESAQNTIEVVHRRISTLKNSSMDADKRSSLRETEIEVVVNPPPPEWQFRNVEDIEKIKRHHLISKHAPSGDYSHKEIDLLHSLVTGSVKMKTLDMVEARDAFRDESDDDADSQFESDFEEDEFDELMSDSGNRAIDPSPMAPPRRKRHRKAHKSTLQENNVKVTMETEDLPSNCVQLKDGKTDNSVGDKCTNEPVYDSVPVESVTQPEEAPTYAVVDRK